MEKMIQVKPSHYFTKAYNSRSRFISYQHQIDEIIKLKPKKILEIGIGNGYVSKHLKERKVNITTLDIDKRLNPDVMGSVLDIPFADKSFDIVACYEVLEHLPYKNFCKALSEIFRVSNSYAILSLPNANKKSIHKFDGEHYWEIGKINYSLEKITNDIKKEGFNIERTYRASGNLYHRFFILKKINEKRN